MKKIIILLISLGLLLIPKIIKADIKSETLEEALESEGIEKLFDKYEENDDQVTIYFFRKQGESVSRDFLNHLNEIYSEHGVFFKTKIYEISNNEDNMNLLYNVYDYLDTPSEYVPFIVVSGSYFTTYSETVDDNLMKTYMEAYMSGNKVDQIEEVFKKYYKNEKLTMFIFFVVIFGFIALIVSLSINNRKEND